MHSHEADDPTMNFSAGPGSGHDPDHRDRIGDDGTSTAGFGVTGFGVEPSEKKAVRPQGVLHFDESVVGLTLADVSVVLVEDRAVVVPIPRSLARQCGFQVLQVDEEHLLEIGVVPVRAPDPIPPRPQLPTVQRGPSGAAFTAAENDVPTGGVAQSGPDTVDPTKDAVYLGAAGPVTPAPRSATEVGGAVDGDELVNARQRMESLAPAPLASSLSFHVFGDDVALAQQVSEKLAKRSAELAPASIPIVVSETVARVDHEASVRDDGSSFNALHDPDLARPFAALSTQRADVGFVTGDDGETSWPEVERRTSDRDSSSADDRAEFRAQQDPSALPVSEGFFAVSPPTVDAVAQETHTGLLSPLAPDPVAPAQVEIYSSSSKSSDSFMGDSSVGEFMSDSSVGEFMSDSSGEQFMDSSVGEQFMGEQFMAEQFMGEQLMGENEHLVTPQASLGERVDATVHGTNVGSGDRTAGTSDETGVPVWFSRDDEPAPILAVNELRAVVVDAQKPLPRELSFALPSQHRPAVEPIEEEVAVPEVAFPLPQEPDQSTAFLLDEDEFMGAAAAYAAPTNLALGGTPDLGGLIPERGGFADEIGGCTPAFEALHVRRSVSDTFAISIDSLRLDAGSIAVVLGREGSGKTQFARTAAGFAAMDAGTIVADGVALHALSADERMIREAGAVGFANVNPDLVDDLAVENLVELPLLIQDVDPREAREIVLSTLEDMRLSHLVTRVGASLSRSEAGRVALIRALISSSVVVLDDALVGLSEGTVDEMVSWIAEAASGGVTLIVVTGEVTVASKFTGNNVHRFSLVRGALMHEPPIPVGLGEASR